MMYLQFVEHICKLQCGIAIRDHDFQSSFNSIKYISVQLRHRRTGMRILNVV